MDADVRFAIGRIWDQIDRVIEPLGWESVREVLESVAATARLRISAIEEDLEIEREEDEEDELAPDVDHE